MSDNRYSVTECCPDCGAENTMDWSIEQDGYKAYCAHCGHEMMLCDECLHADDNQGQKCDWKSDFNGVGHCFRNEMSDDGGVEA